MARGNYGGLGIARTYGPIFGIAYLAVALLEVILGRDGLRIGGTSNSRPCRTGSTGSSGSWCLDPSSQLKPPAKLVARSIGAVCVTIAGFAARGTVGDLLGFEGALPWSYNIVHLGTATVALFAGFALERAKGRSPATAA